MVDKAYIYPLFIAVPFTLVGGIRDLAQMISDFVVSYIFALAIVYVILKITEKKD